MTISLVDIFFKEMRRRRARSLVTKNTLWPSQASVLSTDGNVIGSCLRNSFWKKTGEEQTNPVDDAVVAMGYMGTKIEDGLIDIFKNQGIYENNNVKWQAYGVSGEVDIIIRVPNDINPAEDDFYIVECKSCSGYYINKEVYGYYEGRGANRSYVRGKPKDKHLLQSALYAYVGREKGFKGTIIFYVSRDESKVTDFLITVDEQGQIFIDGDLETRFTVQDILDRYEILRTAIGDGELPDRDFKPEYTDAEVEALYRDKKISKTAHDNHKKGKTLYRDSECNYCEYQIKCLNQNSASTPVQAEDPFETINTDTPEEEMPAFIAHGSF